MKNTTGLLILLILNFLLTDCQKTTCVKGIVSNYVSGQPIKDIKVRLIGYNGTYPDSIEPLECEESEVKTNEDGYYELEVGCGGMDKVEIQIGGEYEQFQTFYFAAKGSDPLKMGKSNEIDFVIDSIDGRLKFYFQNISGTNDTVFLKLHCNALGDVFYYCEKGEATYVPAGGTRSQSWSITANRYVKYYWDTVRFSGFNAAHKDSIFCARNDSTICEIIF